MKEGIAANVGLVEGNALLEAVEEGVEPEIEGNALIAAVFEAENVVDAELEGNPSLGENVEPGVAAETKVN